MHEAVAAIAGCGVSPIVRIPANEGWMVKSKVHACQKDICKLIVFCKGALDSGAHGIIVPLIYTADDTTKLLKSAKFPPQGQRGFGSPFPMERFGIQTTTEYLHQANDALLTIVQIETKEALQNVQSRSHCCSCARIILIEMLLRSMPLRRQRSTASSLVPSTWVTTSGTL